MLKQCSSQSEAANSLREFHKANVPLLVQSVNIMPSQKLVIIMCHTFIKNCVKSFQKLFLLRRMFI
jgi:mRNA deadenylase 3'-5' endonuclease subunit Ccr4